MQGIHSLAWLLNFFKFQKIKSHMPIFTIIIFNALTKLDTKQADKHHVFPNRLTGISPRWRETSCWSARWSESLARWGPRPASPKTNPAVSVWLLGETPPPPQWQLEVTCAALCLSVWAVCSPQQAQVLPHFESAIQTLGRVSSLHVHSFDGADAPSAAPPAGSLVGVVDDMCQLHLQVPVGINAGLVCWSQ